MKALILAAGFGSRLAPITMATPKPLVPYFGLPSLAYAIDRCLNKGLDICVNTHHLHHHIAEFIATHYPHESIHISHEPVILGTGGAVANIREWLGSSDLLVYNADVIADLDIDGLLAQHQRSAALATMALILPVPGASPIHYDDQVVEAIGGQSARDTSSRATFSGIHILSNQFIGRLPEAGFCSIIDSYQQALAAGERVAAYQHGGFWADLGTPLAFWQAHMAVIGAGTPISSLRIHELRKQFKLEPLVIDHGRSSAYTQSSVPDHCIIEQSFIQTHQPIQTSQLSRSIVVQSQGSFMGLASLSGFVIVDYGARGF